MGQVPWKSLGFITLAVIAALLCISECRSPRVLEPDIKKDVIAENEIRSMADQVLLYRETRQRLPNALLDLTRANLIKNAQEDGKVLDPWKRPYLYRLEPSSRAGFVILSQGDDPSTDADDIRSDRLGLRR